MMMIAAATTPAGGGVESITPDIQPAASSAVNVRPVNGAFTVGITVHERWMNAPNLWVTGKFRGQPCEFKNSA
jgi:hypothetical protein